MTTETLRECTSRAAEWLASIQDVESGGWGEYKGAHTNSLNTAEAVLALVESGRSHAGDDNLQRAADYLINQQLDQKDHGAWAREVLKGENVIFVPDVVRTSFALLALNTAGKPPSDNAVSIGIQWLARCQNPDGGWGYTRSQNSSLFPTCLALQALLRMHRAAPATSEQSLKDKIEFGIRHLGTACKNPDGSFGKQPWLIIPHTLHVIRTLKLANRQGFGVDSTDLRRATDWLSRHEDGLALWSNEIIMLGDEKESSWNYTFTHVTPALFLSAFATDLSEIDPLAKQALLIIHDNVDRESSGFAAKRAVSWATAKCVLGLTAVSDVYNNFPERRSSSASISNRHYVFVLMVLLALLSTVLGYLEKFGAQQLSFFSLLVFAGLLAYGYISEKTFLDAISSRWLRKKRIAKD